MKVSVYPVGSRRFVAFVDENEIPIYPLANAFIYDVFLNASFSTKQRIAQELKIVLGYFESHGIDLEKRIAAGTLLSSTEISKFYGQLMLRKDSFERTQRISIIPSVQSKNIRNAIAASLHDSCKVSVETRSGRVRTLRKYLEFLFSHFHGDQFPPQGLINAFETMCCKLKAKESYTNTKSSAQPVELVESVIPNDIYQQFLQIIIPSNVNNPFKSSKLRNYLILSIMEQAGIRRSEVCKIKISDCQFHDEYNKIKVYSYPDDKSDPRINRPDKKTGRSHMSGIKPSLMKDIEFYISHVRNKFTASKKHDFLFVAEKNSHGTAGLPITREMVNYMFSRVSTSLNFKIHPHLLRHKWNERLSEIAKKKGLDREYTEDLRRNAMGHAPDSQMGRVYNDKHEQLIAIELMTRHQEKIDGSKE
ncbi:site-specific integrase [Salinimonas marina]|uniref:Site-specific integrase n=1 Tax=Salinimonas marina TaxID=2785918 RepID=A0A7S9DZW9_9ALTE|nr:site-specific integrase [Salinimonas marina]QPG07018.1 site-specific integrase [Salinimonas marina]